jgi:enoyl-CoA hydratase/carnithine racemase
VAVEVHDEDGVRWVTVSRPETLNALTLDDLEAVWRAFHDAPDETRAAVVTGAGERAFSAGMHLDTFRDLTPATARALIVAVRDFVGSVRKAPFPTICAINGHCLGAAFELALACDIRIAADHATVGLPEIKVGIPSVVDAALLQQHVGLSKAKEMILTGDLYSVAEMEPFGLFNAVVPGDQLIVATRQMLSRVTRGSRAAITSQKRLFEVWQNTSLVDGIEASLDEFAQVFASPETAEQIQAQRAGIGRGGDTPRRPATIPGGAAIDGDADAED